MLTPNEKTRGDTRIIVDDSVKSLYRVQPFAFAEQGDILYGSMQTDAAECQSFAPCGGQAIGEGDVLDA